MYDSYLTVLPFPSRYIRRIKFTLNVKLVHNIKCVNYFVLVAAQEIVWSLFSSTLSSKNTSVDYGEE